VCHVSRKDDNDIAMGSNDGHELIIERLICELWVSTRLWVSTSTAGMALKPPSLPTRCTFMSQDSP
jgi:hypothetical protein